MRTEPSSTIEEGFGSRDVRFGTVDERRSGAARAEGACADIVGRFIVVEVFYFVCCRGRCGRREQRAPF